MHAILRGDSMRGLAVFISDIRNCKYESNNYLLKIIMNYCVYYIPVIVVLIETLCYLQFKKF